MRNSITDIKGLKVGHASNYNGYTGCTVILCEKGATCGIDIRGSASGTRQVDALSISPKTLHESARRRILFLGNHGVNFEEPYNLF